MEKLPLAIVGCGGMGGRHLLGLKELYDSSLNNVELVAACDLRRDNAEHLADEAERLLGRRPAVFQDMAEMACQVPDLQAVDITTDARAHHPVACAAFDLGWHVLCEKPMALTVRGANRILEAQRRAGKVLSIAENYRRDPMSRLTRALLDAGVIGTPYLFLDISCSAGNRIVITPWRHQKNMGGMLLDGGVHNADMMLYYMGDVQQVFAEIRLWERTRYKSRGGNVGGFYERWAAEMPDSITATAEDTLVSVIHFASGTMGQWTQSYAAHGQGFGRRVVFGSRGSLIPGGTRNGISPVVHLDDRQEITGDALLALVPDFALDTITAELFGSKRMASYSMSFPEADRKLLAIEYYELADCIANAKAPEVDGLAGRRAMALCYAGFESSTLNRPVTLDEIEAEETGAYEAEINAELGL
ncbi:MAG: Gfo/Idh/MocA family oxidoreductase [Chloroflexi bacterium]|nr:Gfo/Idh/MocA family oxidoreductase [Chloroflexota bacterium]